MEQINLSIIIPAYNEEKRLLNTLNNISDYFVDQNYEIIVVDDGSTDNTRKICEQFGSIILNKMRNNLGKGYSVKEGVSLASREYMLITDADLATPIMEFDKLYKFIEKDVIVIGSRALFESEVQNTLIRKISGWFGNLLIRTLVHGINDTQCGFKLFYTETAKKLFVQQTINGFGFDFEILSLAQTINIKIIEVPIIWNNIAGSKVKPIDYIYVLKELFHVHKNHLLGVYNVDTK
jgi:dolichyl-phosphate beta-glucosyltransferase